MIGKKRRDELIIDFTTQYGYYQIIKRINNGGNLRFVIRNGFEGDTYVYDTYDKAWSDFVAVIDSMDFTNRVITGI